MTLHVVDTHAHLCSEAFTVDKEAVLAAAHAAGVAWVVNVADTLQTSHDTVAWAAQTNGLYATAGVHPHDAASWNDDSASTLRGLINQPKVVAVGEIGLDYHYDFAPRDSQRMAFRAQLRIAQESGLPVVVHNRAADADTIADLGSAAFMRGVLHCFWSDLPTAQAALEMGFYLGVGGPITFANTSALRDVLRHVPLERVMIETDAPYLAPKPFRGKRNEPAFVYRVAEALAELHDITPEHVARVTSENAAHLFGVAHLVRSDIH